MNAACRSLALLVMLSLAGGCQEHELEEVAPKTVATSVEHLVVAAPERIDIMLVVDASGSMMQLIEPYGSSPGPRSKWDELLFALLDPGSGFVERNRGSSRMALAVFPEDSGYGCSPGFLHVPFGEAPGSNVNAIVDDLRRICPVGGTPTTITLQRVTAEEMFPIVPDVGRLVVLLTDGLPNCNAANADKCDLCNRDPSTCRAPGGCRSTNHGDDECLQGGPWLSGEDCLDDEGLVAQIEDMRSHGIDTLVIGFGEDLQTGEAAEVLSRAAIAGGWARNEEPRFYGARNGAELQSALESAIRPMRCRYQLEEAPPSEGLVTSVTLVDRQSGTESRLEQGTDWSFRPGTTREIVLEPARCEQVHALEGQHEIEVRWAAPL